MSAPASTDWSPTASGRQLGFPPENTLHDLRWGRQFTGKVDGKKLDAYVWVFLISGRGAARALHRRLEGRRQHAPAADVLGASAAERLRGVSKPGWIVWSRVYVSGGALNFDTGLAEVVKLPAEETEERWRLTTPQWPIMHAVLQGITRDQMMGRHKANHIQVAYAPDKASAGVPCSPKPRRWTNSASTSPFAGRFDHGRSGETS